MTSLISSSNLSPPKNNPLSFPIVKNSGFFKKQQKTLDEFIKANQTGMLELAKNSEQPTTFFGRLWDRIYPPYHFGNPIIMKICKAWKRCVAGLAYHNGNEVHQGLNSIIQERRFHPKEFRATIPGLEDQVLAKVTRYMRAMAFLFQAIDSSYKRNPEKIRLYINQAVQWYHKAGIDENDTSLKDYHRLFLDHACTLEEYLNEISKLQSNT